MCSLLFLSLLVPSCWVFIPSPVCMMSSPPQVALQIRQVVQSSAGVRLPTDEQFAVDYKSGTEEQRKRGRLSKHFHPVSGGLVGTREGVVAHACREFAVRACVCVRACVRVRACACARACEGYSSTGTTNINQCVQSRGVVI